MKRHFIKMSAMAVIYAVAFIAFFAFCDDNESLELSTWIAGKVIAAVVMALCVVALKKINESKYFKTEQHGK